MKAPCRCTIPATCWTTRSCLLEPACSRASSKPACRQTPMHESASNEPVPSLHDLSAVDLLAGYRSEQFSPSEVLEDVLAHIALWEPHIKALYAFDPEGARAAAKASTERWQRGQPMGPLDGVPTEGSRPRVPPPRSRRISRPRACRCRSVPPPAHSNLPQRTRRRQRGC